MSIARHHADWLSLVEVSGPFLSMPVLTRAFPHGLVPRDSVMERELRLAYEEWLDDQSGLRPDPAMHRAWIRHVLTTVLEYHGEHLQEGPAIPQGLAAEIPEHGEMLRPDIVLMRPGRSEPARLLIRVLPFNQDLDKPLPGLRWKASAATRMATLLRAVDVPLGLLTNGEHWMLVYAPRSETTGFASWYSQLWLDEPITLQAFRSLLETQRFFGVAEADTPEVLFRESAQNQQEVTDQLGYQVRQAVEVLVGTLDRIDRDRGLTLLEGISEQQLYEAALTVMMRLVFLFSAEERGMLRLGDKLYDQHYAVSTLRAQLREAADRLGEEVLERRSDAWSRLLATFRAVYGGVTHSELRLPAYGGHLFDPDRFPFLEGRPLGTDWVDDPAQPLPIDNRTVLHLLEALQVLKVKVPGGGYEPRLLSFRALDIEQIGHVYEGLLDHTAVRTTEPVLGLQGSKDREPEVPVRKLEELARKGETALITFLREETGRSEKALTNSLKPDLLADTTALLIACDNDHALFGRVRPFANLLREDSFGHPIVIPAGSIYVTAGTDRRSTGTHYTPRLLTEPIVQHTLDPLVYHGPAEGLPKEQWTLRSAGEILGLKVCDMAMGSGAFLVQACRYMSERVVEAWEVAEATSNGRVVITPEGDLSTGSSHEQPLPCDAEERLALARRIVADRCLYGVDKNPLAVEMAKLSLWLITLQKDRPFNFLDHALRCGDSLLGVDIDQLKTWSLNRDGPVQLSWFTRQLEEALDRALHLRRRIAATTVSDARDAEAKARLLRDAEEDMRLVRLGADLLVASVFASDRVRNDVRQDFLHRFSVAVDVYGQRRAGRFTTRGATPGHEGLVQLRREADNLLGQHGPFHWPLEFPEVYVDTDRPGFAAIVGNPPFQGGIKVAGALGPTYRDYIVEYLAKGMRGLADLCAYFFLRAYDQIRHGGIMGLLATNTIAQGDTRVIGLDQIKNYGGVIFRAIPSRSWPGEATLEVAHLWLLKGDWNGPCVLDDQLVSGITPLLTVPGSVSGTPYRLAANAGKSFIGSFVLGTGFILQPEDAERLCAKDARNRDVIFPYLGGEDLNSIPDQSPTRWIINFRDWSLETAALYDDCLDIVMQKVKPERDQNTYSKTARERWWQYERIRPELYNSLVGKKRVLVKAQVSKTWAWAFVPNGWVYDSKLIVFSLDEADNFAILQSTFHWVWSLQYGTTLRLDMSYTPTTNFETYPFPSSVAGLDLLGEQYHEYRSRVMIGRQEGLTKTYNRFHNRTESAEDIAELRRLHLGMDQAVAVAYGWDDLDLDHDFHETKQGLRFTISESARREVLDRLLHLNHERYAEEVKQGLHDRGSKSKSEKAASKKPATKGNASKQPPTRPLPLKPLDQKTLF